MRREAGIKSSSPPLSKPHLPQNFEPFPLPVLPRPDIPVGGRLAHFVEQWEELTNNKWVLSIARKGFKIPFKPVPPLLIVPINLSQSSSLLLREEIAVERVQNPGSHSFYSWLFLVHKKNGKLGPVIDLSLLNHYIHKQHFKMETVKSVRQSVMYKDWAVSIDLTDAYLHVPIHPTSRKYLQFVYDHQVFQFTALPFGMSLSPWGFMKLMNVIATHLRLRAVSLFPYLDNWLIRDLMRNRLIAHTRSNGSEFRHHSKSKEVRFDSNTTIHIYRYGISNTTKNSQSSSGSSKSSYSDHQNNSLTNSGGGTDFPFSFGQTKCSSRLNSPGQIAFTTPANVPVISLETSQTSSRSSSYDHQDDQISFKMVDEQSICSGNALSPSRPPNLPLHGCQSFR